MALSNMLFNAYSIKLVELSVASSAAEYQLVTSNCWLLITDNQSTKNLITYIYRKLLNLHF